MSAKKHAITYGFHAVETLLNGACETVQVLYCLQGRQDKRLKTILTLAEKHHLVVKWRSRHQLDELTSENHQGVVAVAAPIAEVYDESFLKSRLTSLFDKGIVPFLLVLDGVTDPHNLGACLRSAEAAGVQCIIVPKDNAATLSPAAIKVACGAAEMLPLVRVTNLSRTLQWLQQQGVWVVGTAGEASQAHHELDLTGPLAIVMGSEGKGLRRLTREHCDHLVKIPVQGSVSSLNVSVATGICLFEALRQRC